MLTARNVLPTMTHRAAVDRAISECNRTIAGIDAQFMAGKIDDRMMRDAYRYAASVRDRAISRAAAKLAASNG